MKETALTDFDKIITDDNFISKISVSYVFEEMVESYIERAPESGTIEDKLALIRNYANGNLDSEELYSSISQDIYCQIAKKIVDYHPNLKENTVSSLLLFAGSFVGKMISHNFISDPYVLGDVNNALEFIFFGSAVYFFTNLAFSENKIDPIVTDDFFPYFHAAKVEGKSTYISALEFSKEKISGMLD